jgi:hypothetical protein
MLKKRVLIALTIIVLLTAALVYANRIPQGGNSFAAFYPWSFAVTTDLSEPSAEVTLPLTLLEGRQNSKRTDPNLYSAEIISPADHDGFRVTITEVEEVGELYHKGDPIYIYQFAVSVPLTSNFTFKDARLLLSYNDGSSEDLYIGDLSLIYVPEDVTDQHLKKLRALPVLNMETWEMTALIIEFFCEEELRLESFDFGLPKYGIDTERVTCLQSSMDKLEELYFDKTLDQKFEGIYSLPKTTTREISLGEIVIKPGLNTLVIPFTFIKGAKFSPICALGGLLHYLVDDAPYAYSIETIPYVIGYPPSPIEEYLNDVRH